MWTPVMYFDFAGMAADQRKKRVKPSSLAGCRSRDQHRVKRKRLEPPQPDMNTRPNISLEWDSKKKSVVSKRGQIGISWRQLLPFIEPTPNGHKMLLPFIEPTPNGHKMLADVFSVPQEIYELENLSEVLSYEVWQNHLSEKERSSLSQFLPEDSEPDTIVRDLLSGNNFHFGNPYVKWSASLCSGELHPDNVLQEEQSLKVCKKANHSDLQKYHNDMIVNLQMWKEKWASCSDPEVDILQNTWSSMKCAGKTLPPSKTQFYDTGENLVATPESCSWANSENANSSDNQHGGLVHGESQRRKVIPNKMSDSSPSGTKVAALPKKGENLHKRDITHRRETKYMSYVKVSKELHGRVKSSMKHGGNSIRPRSLNNILGSIDSLNVQPFEKFVEEERKKLHDYWLKLANKDISESFAAWRKRKLQRQEVICSLSEEIEQRVQSKATNNEEEGSKDDLMEQLDDCAEGISRTSVEGVEKVQYDDLLLEQMDNEEHEKERMASDIFEEQTYNDTEMIEEEDDVPENALSHDHNKQQIASLTSNPLIDSTEIQLHGNSTSVKDGNLNQVDISHSQGAPHPSSIDVWPLHAIYQSTAANDGYAPARELSVMVRHPQFIQEQPLQILDRGANGLNKDSGKDIVHGKSDGTSVLDRHPQFIQEQPLQILDQEPNGLNKDSGKDILHRESDGTSFLDSETNEDRNEYLQSLFQGQGRFPYHHEAKNSGVHFHCQNVLMMETDQFSQPNNTYTHPNIRNSIFSDRGQYTMPRPEQLPVNIRNWATTNAVRLPAPPFQPHLNSGQLIQNFYTSENGAQERWPTFESSVVGMNHSFSSESKLDQTLFSVLSECNELRPVTRPITSVDSTGSTEQFIQAGNYSGISGGIPSSSSVLHQSPNPLNYLSGHEPKINNLGWMGFPQQNSEMHESMGKPLLRSWNQ